MPVFSDNEIGPLYDVGIGLRVGNDTLSVLNKSQGTTAVHKIAYMVSTQQPQEEATELQEKAKLIQLQASILDREFDQWVQDTQQDWSGGMLQRLGGSGSDPTRYFDGEGLLWPIADYVPQRPYLPAVLSPVGTVAAAGPGLIVCPAGMVDSNVGSQRNGWFATWNASSGGPTMYFQDGSNASPFSLQGGFTGSVTIQDVCSGDGYAWVVSLLTGAGPNYRLNQVRLTTGATMVINRFDDLTQGDLIATTTIYGSVVTAGPVGNKFYVAVKVKYDIAAGPPIHTKQYIRLFDFSNNQGTDADAPVGFVDLVVPSGRGDDIVAMEFAGDNLYVGIQAESSSAVAIMAFNLPTQSWSTVAYIRGFGNVKFCQVAGGIFILAKITAAGVSFVEMFLLQGQNLQSVGTIPQALDNSYLVKPASLGPYCFFQIEIGAGARGNTNVLVDTYAYDVLHGRLFKWISENTGGTSFNGLPVAGQCAAFGARQFQQNNISQFGLASPRLNYNSTVLAQELLGGLIVNSQLFRTSFFVTASSLRDFTSAQPKLYRDMLVTFSPLGAAATQGVTLQAWLDKDPLDIVLNNTAPDFTISITGTTNSGATSLRLAINQLARKLVYSVLMSGGVVTTAPASKLFSVATRSSSGWAWHLFLLAGRQVVTNGNTPGDFCFEHQGYDEVIAYNFLRQIWRQRGGQCQLTLPNGDSYPALLQMLRSRSPKLFGPSFVASQDARYESVIEVAIREDIL